MDDEAVGINNRKSVICVVTCMIMIHSYAPGFSRRCTSYCWCIWNWMVCSTRRIQWHSPMVSGWVTFTFSQISDFLRQFYAFSKFLLIFKWPISEESITMCKSRFFPTKKKKKKEKLILGAKMRFCGNSHKFSWKCWKHFPRFSIFLIKSANFYMGI